MKSKFREYYLLSDEMIRNLWENAVFVFDTNVLFNLYRYSKETSTEFLTTIKKLKSRVWIPFQIAKEFHKNRLNIINSEKDIYDSFIKKLNTLHEEFSNKNRNPFLSDELNRSFAELKAKITLEMDCRKNEYDDLIITDGILNDISAIFENRVGEDYSEEKILEIRKEGEYRYKNDIPPGFEDKKKPEAGRYGDFIIWNQVIDKANEEKKPIIFITDDGKEDWWLINLGKTISPRPELLKEFEQKTGQICHFYKPFQFLNYSNSYLGNDIKKEVIQEVKDFKLIDPILSDKGIIKIELIIKCLNSKSELTRFTEIVNTIGYQCVVNDIDANIFQLIILLPNIPDLERRFKEKYLLLLKDYNLQLIEYRHILTEENLPIS